MRIELNDMECNYRPFASILKCNYCMWKSVPTHFCVKFCRIGYIFRTTRIVSSIFHL